MTEKTYVLLTSGILSSISIMLSMNFKLEHSLASQIMTNTEVSLIKPWLWQDNNNYLGPFL